MLQRLPMNLSKVEAINTSKNLLNEIHQIILYLYWAKNITKNVYNRIMNSITNSIYRMNTIFINSKYSKTSDPHRFLFNLADETNLAYTIHGKI